MLVEKRRFEPTAPLLGAPLWMMSLELHGDLWQRKTRVPALSYGVVSVILGLAIFVQLRLVAQTYRRTDGQTDGHTMTMTASLARTTKCSEGMISETGRLWQVQRHYCVLSCVTQLDVVLQRHTQIWPWPSQQVESTFCFMVPICRVLDLRRSHLAGWQMWGSLHSLCFLTDLDLLYDYDTHLNNRLQQPLAYTAVVRLPTNAALPVFFTRVCVLFYVIQSYIT